MDWEAVFIEQMRERREVRQMTQTDLAKAVRNRGLSFHQQTIQRIEIGERPVRLNEAYVIAEELGLSIEGMTSADPYGARSLRYAADTFRAGAREVAENLFPLMERLTKAGQEIHALYEDKTEHISEYGGRPDERTWWIIRWELKYEAALSALVDAFEACAVAAGSTQMGIRDIDRNWVKLLPSHINLTDEAVSFEEWAKENEVEYDLEYIGEMESDELYRELNRVVYEDAEEFKYTPEAVDQLETAHKQLAKVDGNGRRIYAEIAQLSHRRRSSPTPAEKSKIEEALLDATDRLTVNADARTRLHEQIREIQRFGRRGRRDGLHQGSLDAPGEAAGRIDEASPEQPTRQGQAVACLLD